MTFTHALATNNYGPAKFIVDASAANGTHTTIAAALTSASSGDTIFIRPGTFTENLTLKAGVNLSAYIGDADSPNVTIAGTCTFTAAGTVTISGVRLQTNSAALLAVTGSAASIVNLRHCYLDITNSDGITYSSSSPSSAINVMDSNGNLGTTGIKVFNHSGAGTLTLAQGDFSNTGASVTASTVSAGALTVKYAAIAFPTTTSSTAVGGFFHCEINTAAQNVAAITHGATAVFGVIHCHITTGSASAVVVNAATCNMISCVVNSTNTNPVSGSGTILYSDINYEGSGVGLSTTTVNAALTRNGVTLSTKQPAFLGDSAGQSNITGDGTAAALTFTNEIFDQGSNFAASVFTAPYTGRYVMSVYALLSGLTASHTTGEVKFSVSNRNANAIQGNLGAMRNAGNAFDITSSTFVDMDAADTASMTCTVANGTKVVSIDTLSYFSGYIVC